MSDQVNILLVDDQPRNLLALESILGGAGRLVFAHSGIEALRQLLQEDFAVILLDVHMPGMDGFQTAALIRERDRSRDIPIIFLTALSENETLVFRGYELGAVDYISKPFHPDILRAKVNVFVELFRKREAIKKQAQDLAHLIGQNQLILDAAADGVCGIGLHGEVTFINPAAARMLARRAEEAEKAEFHSLVHPRFPDVEVCDPERCPVRRMVGGDFERGEIEDMFFRRDGSSFPVEFVASPMHDDDGRHTGSVITFRDVTQKRAAALTAEAERRYHEAEAQSRAKDNFLATLSHELRTPMTAILGWLQYVRSGNYSEAELMEALETIESSARLQARLIDDMLDVSRMVLGKFDVELKPTRVGEIVDAALATAGPAAAAKDLQLAADVEDRDVRIDADASRMQQVIGNLLSNAIKFSPRGKTVALSVGSNGSGLLITVSDQGEGIDPSFLPHIFDRLTQAETSQTRMGLGLGLAIARHIVQLHRGEITAESDGPGRGARFTVKLPLRAAREGERPRAHGLRIA